MSKVQRWRIWLWNRVAVKVTVFYDAPVTKSTLHSAAVEITWRGCNHQMLLYGKCRSLLGFGGICKSQHLKAGLHNAGNHQAF